MDAGRGWRRWGWCDADMGVGVDMGIDAGVGGGVGVGVGAGMGWAWKLAWGLVTRQRLWLARESRVVVR